MRDLELLIPAGNLENLKVAIDYGADAVYIGGEFFSLRAKAKNFTKEDMKAGIEYAHDRGKKTVFFTAADNPYLHEFCDEVVLVASLEYLENGNLISPQFPMLLVLDLIYSEYINIDSVFKSAILEDTVTTLNKKEDDRKFYMMRSPR